MQSFCDGFNNLVGRARQDIMQNLTIATNENQNIKLTLRLAEPHIIVILSANGNIYV